MANMTEFGRSSLLDLATLEPPVPEMQTRARLYELLRYAEHEAFDHEVYGVTQEEDAGSDDEPRSS